MPKQEKEKQKNKQSTFQKAITVPSKRTAVAEEEMETTEIPANEKDIEIEEIPANEKDIKIEEIPVPAKEVAQDKCKRYVEQVKKDIADLFKTIEACNISDDTCMAYWDRASLTIVGGKMVYVRMLELYRDQEVDKSKNIDFKDWYKENLEEISAQIVAAGRLAGMPVDFAIPLRDRTSQTEELASKLSGPAYIPNPSATDLKVLAQFCRKFGFKDVEDIEQKISETVAKAEKAVALDLLKQYVQETKTWMDLLFKPMEDLNIGDDTCMAYWDRANWSSVGDKTVYEWIQELYRDQKVDNPKKLNFKDWYKENLEEISAQIVTAGDLAKACAAFVTPKDSTPQMKEASNMLRRSVCYSADYSPAGLEIFVQFCRNFGFNNVDGDTIKRKYYNVTAEMNLARDKAIERVFYHYRVASMASSVPDSPALINAFFGEILKEYDGSWDKYKEQFQGSIPLQNASAAVTLCICYMAAAKKSDGKFKYTIAQMLSAPWCRAAKRQAAKECMNRALKEKDEWLGATLFLGQRAMLDHIDEEAKGIDFNDLKLRKKMLYFYCAGRVLQEVEKILADEKNVALRKGRDNILSKSFDEKSWWPHSMRSRQEMISDAIRIYSNQANDVAHFFTTLFNGERGRITLASPYPQKSIDGLAGAKTDLALERHAVEQQTANARKNVRFRETVPVGACVAVPSNVPGKNSATAHIYELRAIGIKEAFNTTESIEDSKNWIRMANDILMNGSMNNSYRFVQDSDKTFHLRQQSSEKKLNGPTGSTTSSKSAHTPKTPGK